MLQLISSLVDLSYICRTGTYRFVVQERLRDDRVEENIVGMPKFLKVLRSVKFLRKYRKLALQHVGHEILLQVVHYKCHVGAQLEEVCVANARERQGHISPVKTVSQLRCSFLPLNFFTHVCCPDLV